MKKITLLLLYLFSVFSFSCTQLLPTPTLGQQGTGQEDVSTNLEAPQDFTISQGLFRKIEFSWKAVKNVSRYEIFSAPTAYDNFTKVKEVNSSSLFTSITVKPNTDCFYKIRAVDFDDNYSNFSDIHRGTSLAIPVISDITINKDDESTVYWFMSNADAYFDSVCYTIICKDSESKEIDRKTFSGNQLGQNSVTFTNLTPNTKYFYQVEAYLLADQNNVEISDSIDADTARRTRPDAPKDLVATQGTHKEIITLSFVLPNFVDVALGNGVYESNPLFFKIYRRVKLQEDAEPLPWQMISSYFGYNKDKVGGTSFTSDGLESDYEPGKLVSFEDTNVESGIIYEYKVQSFADNVNREISSENLSASEVTAWTMAIPSFKKASFESSKNQDESAIISSKLTFDFQWENHGAEKNYYYQLLERKYKLEIDNENSADTIGVLNDPIIFSTKEEIAEFVRTFDLSEPTSVRGYYTYELQILPLGETDESKAVFTIPLYDRIIVTDAINIPVIEGFSVKDGFVDKFEISWKYNSTYRYEINYQDVTDNVAMGEKNVISELPNEILNAEDGSIVTYTHDATSGCKRKYSLVAILGVTIESDPITAETLGTPEIVGAGTTYTSYAIKFKPVQKASSYNLIFSYENQDLVPCAEYKGELSVPLNIDELTLDAEGYYYYEKNELPGYNNAQMAGWPIVLKVEAISVDTKGTELGKTESSITQSLIGPALTNAISDPSKYSDRIEITWNAIPNAKKYLIKRDRYLVDNTTIDNTDFYYVSTDGTSLSVLGIDGDISNSIKVSLADGKFTLTDIYTKDNNTGFKWNDSQDKINWGFPYHYTVFPLENETDDFDVETQTLASKVTYTSLDKIEVIGSALGYGHNVMATKSEDPNSIFITWDEPYLSDIKTYDISLWRSPSGDNVWEKTDKCSLNESGDSFTVTPTGDERILAFDYAVRYDAKDEVPNQSYLNYLATQTDDYGEPCNKGYAFAIQIDVSNVSSNGEPSFSERIRWTLWDYEERKRGPKENTNFVVNMKNKNLGNDWKNIANVALDGSLTINNDSSYDTIITQQGNSIIISPSSTASDYVHNGLLKVLRDYKHYVQVLAVRNNSEGNEIYASYGEDESKVYATRQITDAELCVNVALIVADALYQSGIPYKTVSGTQTRTVDGALGQFKLSTSPVSLIDYTNKVTWGFNGKDENYIHKFKNGISSTCTESFTSPFTLSSDSSSTETGSDNHVLYHLPALDISVVSHESGYSSYTGVVNLTVGQSGKDTVYSLTYKKDGTTIKTLSKDSQQNFYNLFPYDIGTKHNDGDSSLNSSFVVYQFPWWN